MPTTRKAELKACLFIATYQELCTSRRLTEKNEQQPSPALCPARDADSAHSQGLVSHCTLN